MQGCIGVWFEFSTEPALMIITFPLTDFSYGTVRISYTPYLSDTPFSAFYITKLKVASDTTYLLRSWLTYRIIFLVWCMDSSIMLITHTP